MWDARRDGRPPWLPADVTANTCPVSTADRDWIELWYQRLTAEFGREVVRRPVALPTPDFVPPAEGGTESQTRAALPRVCAVMNVDPARFELTFFSPRVRHDSGGRSRHTVGRYTRLYRASKFDPVDKTRKTETISVAVDDTRPPIAIVSTLGHELAHARLLGEGRIGFDGPEHENITDLATVFFGMGVFTANTTAAFTRASRARAWAAAPLGDFDDNTLNGVDYFGVSRLGYLGAAQFGYALACHCWLRGELDPPWARYVAPEPRTALRQGIAYLRHRTGHHG